MEVANKQGVIGLDKKEPSAINVFWINLANLLKVKTIITLAFVTMLILTTLKKIEVPQEIMMIASSVVTYFFTKQEKNDSDKKKQEE